MQRLELEQISTFGVRDRPLRGRILVTPSRFRAFVDFERVEVDELEARQGTHGQCASNETIERPRELVDLLRKRGLRVEPEFFDSQLNALESALQLDQSPEPVLVAEGQKPRDGIDGYFEWSGEVETTSPSSEPLYKQEHSPHRRAISKGGIIGYLHEPKSGEAGIDVFGEACPAEDGQPQHVEAGPNVEFNAEERAFEATESGWIEVRGNRLSVYPVFQVRGNLDYSTGEIEFVGSVEIEGDVLDGFDVVAQENAYIGGTVGAADILVDGRVKIQGGVAGKKSAAVKTGDQLSARFLSGCEVESKGRIDIKHGIMHSDVGTLDRLQASHGKLLGGRVIAGTSLEAKTLGSSMGIQTVVICGVPFPIIKKVERLQTRLGELTQALSEVQSELEKLCGEFDSFAKLPEPRRYAIQSELEFRRELEAEKSTVNNQIQMLREKLEYNNAATVTVRDQLYPGVELQIGRYKTTIEKHWEGPLRLEVNPAEDTIDFIRVGD